MHSHTLSSSLPPFRYCCIPRRAGRGPPHPVTGPSRPASGSPIAAASSSAPEPNGARRKPGCCRWSSRDPSWLPDTFAGRRRGRRSCIASGGGASGNGSVAATPTPAIPADAIRTGSTGCDKSQPAWNDEFKLYLTSNISMEDYNMGYCLTGFVERRCQVTNTFQMTHFAVIKRQWPPSPSNLGNS